MSDRAIATEKRFRLRTPWRAVSAMFLLNGLLSGIWASRIPAIAEQHQLSEAPLGMLLLAMAAGQFLPFHLLDVQPIGWAVRI